MTAEALDATLAASRDAGSVLERARAAVASGTGLAGVVDLTGLDQSQTKAWGEALGKIRREVDTMLAQVAHAQALRSAPEQGADGMARRHGEPPPHDLVASQTGGSERDAKKLIEVGQTLAEAEKEPPAQPEDPSASDAGPKFPHVSKAVNHALISIDAAAMITRMLEKVHDVADPEAWADAERTLVAKARLLNLRALSRVVRRTEANLYRAGVEAREQELREARYLHVFEDNTGMVVINGKLDPETAAPIKVALDALVAQGLQARQGRTALTRDERTPKQMRADALGLLARHSLKCDNPELGLAGVTLVVRMDLEDVLASASAGDGATGGERVAEIDGIGQPISAGTARRLAGEAGVVPIVTSGESVGLDVGRKRYHFSGAQKLALIERDGGCAMCGAPPSWCEAHHIQEWSTQAGKTDIANGVMLCRRCHQDLHRDGWVVKASLNETWFTPPAHIDPQRRPRPGGRMLHGGARLDQDGIDRLENATRTLKPVASPGVADDGQRSRDRNASGGKVPGREDSRDEAKGKNASGRGVSGQNISGAKLHNNETDPPPLTLCHRAASAVPECKTPVARHSDRRSAHRFMVHGLTTGHR